MKFEIDSSIVHWDEKDVVLPYSAIQHVRLEGSVVLLLASWTRPTEEVSYIDDPVDIKLPSIEQNVLALSVDGTHLWTAPEAPHETTEDEAEYNYRYLFTISGRLFVRHQNEHLYELDPETGDIVADWPDNCLPIGDDVVELPGSIDRVVSIDDIVVVRVIGVDRDEGDTYGFTKDGTQLWRSDTYFGSVYLSDDELHAKRAVGPRRSIECVVDPATGSVLDEEEVPDFN